MPKVMSVSGPANKPRIPPVRDQGLLVSGVQKVTALAVGAGFAAQFGAKLADKVFEEEKEAACPASK